ncbi:MAG: tetratricopeptide repeat protein, partial [Burkholderiales bacterium]|nr:tetratricopeptide repeat protein [Burkholderiales bacterium]
MLVGALCAALAIAVVALYFRSLDNPLVFDDRALMTPRVLGQYAQSMFAFDLRWFSYVTLGWTWALAGDSLPVHRSINLVLHSATCIALFIFLRTVFEQVLLPAREQPGRLPGMTDWSDDAPCWYAFAGALLFAVHPVAVYGVAYLVQRSIVMATLFSILSLLCFLRGMAGGRAAWYLAAALCYFVALFSKEHAVMLPAVALALAVLVDGGRADRGVDASSGQPAGRRSFGQSLAALLPLLRSLWLPILLYAAIALFVIARTRGIFGAPYEPFVAEMLAEVDGARPQLSIEDVYPLSVLTQLWLFFGYLGTWLLPNPSWMSIDLRPGFARTLTEMPQLLGVPLAIGYAALATWMLLAGRTLRLLGFALLAPLLLFSTELSTVRLQEPMVLYRSYLWMFALPAALPLLGHLLPTRVALGVLLVAAVVLCFPASNRLASFETPYRVWDDAVKKLDEPWQLGAERPFIVRGLEQLRLGRAREALADFQRAITIAPGEFSANLNAGVALMQLGQPKEALGYYRRALELRPASGEPAANAAAALLALGDLRGAADTAAQATRLAPKNPIGWTNLGLALLRMGQAGPAQEAIERSLALRPDDADTLAARATLWMAAKEPARAMADLQRAVEANPRSSSSFYNRGTLHAQLGDIEAALRDFTRAIEIEPGSRDALANRATALFIKGSNDAALADLNRL